MTNELLQFSSVFVLTLIAAESQVLAQVLEVIDPPECSRRLGHNKLFRNFPSWRILVWVGDAGCTYTIPRGGIG